MNDGNAPVAEVRKGLIVTGGSRGIGAATVIAGARAGYDVCFSFASDLQAADRVVAAVEKGGGRARAVRADTTEEGGVAELFDAAGVLFGTPDAVVINAGISGKVGRLADVEVSDLRKVFETNILGAVLVSRASVRAMSSERGGSGGSIVIVSSRAAALGGAGEWIHYAASKGAADTLTIGLAREVAGEGIRVNAVRPGLIDTQIHARAGLPDRLERVAPSIPLKRAGTPEEVAAAILWLAGEEASYVTGALLDVAGGR